MSKVIQILLIIFVVSACKSTPAQEAMWKAQSKKDKAVALVLEFKKIGKQSEIWEVNDNGSRIEFVYSAGVLYNPATRRAYNKPWHIETIKKLVIKKTPSSQVREEIY